jgi:hypothetical protein
VIAVVIAAGGAVGGLVGSSYGVFWTVFAAACAAIVAFLAACGLVFLMVALATPLRQRNEVRREYDRLLRPRMVPLSERRKRHIRHLPKHSLHSLARSPLVGRRPQRLHSRSPSVTEAIVFGSLTRCAA